MAVTYFPFDSLSAENRDRAANSQIFADYLKSFFSDGIFPVLDQFPNMHQLAVHASNPAGMSVVVDTGMGLISGRQYAQDAERTLQIPAADISLPRKDRIVLRMDLNTQYRNNELYVVAGTAASSPQPPALTRNNVVYELALATISVAANATSITAADITDERANTDVCGYVTNVLGQVDTSVINAQFQAFFEQTQEDTADWEDAQQAAFTSWFNTIKGQLGEDAAGNLQNQIGTLSGLTTSEKSNLVGAINEVNAKEPDVLDTMEEIDANTDAGKATGALATKQLISEIDERFPNDVRIFAEGSGEDVEYYAQLGADTASKKLLGDSSQILAIFHASTSSAVRFTADRKITGITMISEDVRTNTVQLRINNETQAGVNIAQIGGGIFGCRVYDVTLNVGDEVAVTSSGGSGADMVLLSGMVDAAQVTS